LSCSSCGHENPAAARFCNECGARLAATLLAPEPRSYTPRHLVEKILASKSALEGERKPVTVLFADVARSMELAEQVDVEEWHRILDRLFRILANGVHRYEGTINQYTGDGIMALFGAPLAYEDHAQRACAAALDLARELAAFAADVRLESGLDLAVRMGLNSGEVVVGRIGDDLRMDYTAQGHVVGLADRIQRLAPPGGVSLTEATARLVAGFYELADRGEQGVKGSSALVRVFDLRGPGPIRTRLENSRARGFSRFVGRESELARLEAALRDARAGRPQVVLVTAEPGAGKSRLCHQLVERSEGAALFAVRAVSHGRLLPFHVVAALARTLFGLGEEARGEGVREFVERGLAFAEGASGSISADGAAAPGADSIEAGLWLDLLGAPDPTRAPTELEPGERRTRLFSSLCDLVEARGRRELAVVWIDDLHWLDSASEAALARLATHLLGPAAAGARVLFLATSRPEYRPSWSDRAVYLDVPPLAARDASSLLDDWLGSDPALAPLRSRIETRARGNPLFLEEIVRSLAERGAIAGRRGAYAPAAVDEEIALPDTVQSVLASRIDRLSSRDKDLLRAAAVIGREVPIELLRAVIDLPRPELAASLARLAAADLLGTVDPFGKCAFRHPLTHEVAYRTQLADGRRRTHGDVARALIGLDGAEASARAPLLAHHYEEAGETLEAAHWHERAGRRIARSDPEDGARHCHRAAELVASLDESAETLTLALTSRIALLEIGRIAGMEERDARLLFEEGRSVAERLGDESGHAFLLTSYGRSCGLAGDVAEYLRCAERAAELAARSDDATLAFEMSSVLAHALLSVGRLGAARTIARRSLVQLDRDPALARILSRSTAPVFCRFWWALASAYIGETAEARRALEAVLADPEEGGLAALYGTHGFLCEVLRWDGDLDGALAHGLRATELAAERGSPLTRVEAGVFLGTAALASGDAEAATDLVTAALALARSRRAALGYEPRLLATLAEAKAEAGDPAAARAILAEARELVARGRGFRLGACDVALAEVRVLWSEGDRDTADLERAGDRARAIAGEIGAGVYLESLERERARIVRGPKAIV
jgi:class 3 adenylate cyclase/tetratricopeptide (TPR) repeat protein